MRYKLVENALLPVKKLEQDGMVTTNPTDAQVDAAGAGYPLVETVPPEYDESTQYLVHGYAQEADCIRETWTVTNKTNAMLCADIDAQMAALNEAYSTTLKTPVLYPATGKYYLPNWAGEYYTPILVDSATVYPIAVWDVQMATTLMTKAELEALRSYLVGVVQTQLTETMTQLAALTAQKAALEGAE